ncbi:FAD/NAD(P)-binding protein [Actinocorallia longicatena]|uniref:FAD/NAD(P)-binding protein n=1 Tax=Actinocorallia longicatena TaxID=111803 RepID=A0ABP6Q977_9ACTN
MRTVAMIGGGASGSLAAVHLLRRAAGPLRVVLIDRDGRHGLGQAYATSDPAHLLNAGAVKMSAFDDDPGDLLRWARAEGMDVADGDYLPRAVYGRYLRSVLGRYRDRITELTGNVVSLTPPAGGRPARLVLEDGSRVAADAVVVATGNRTAAARTSGTNPRYVADPWSPGALEPIRDGAPVLVVGTGLTMVDVAVTVTRAHPGTVVHAVSRHGLLPRPHRCTPAPPAEVALPAGEVRLDRIFRAVMAAVRANGGDWHAVVDGLRPRVPGLWEAFSADDKRRFLASLARYWEIHRHRIPPVTADRVDRLRATGRLGVLRGSVTSAAADAGGVTVRLDGSGGPRELRVGWLVNATGPTRDLTADPLLNDLFASGAARRDPLDLGLEADACGSLLDLRGRPQPRLFTLGPTLRGQRYETTAVPEIRAQAAALATALLASLEDEPALTPPEDHRAAAR